MGLRRLLRWTSLPDARLRRHPSLQVLGTGRWRGAPRTHARPLRSLRLSARRVHRCIVTTCDAIDLLSQCSSRTADIQQQGRDDGSSGRLHGECS